MTPPQKIAILLPNLQGGGAERLAINLADDWIGRGIAVEFILMQHVGELLKIAPTAAKISSLNAPRIRSAILPLARHLRKNAPDVLWANMWPLTSAAVLAHKMSGCAGRLYLTDHNHLSTSYQHELPVSLKTIRRVMRLTYSRADGVTGVSQGVSSDMRLLSGLKQERIKTIYNPTARGIIQMRATQSERNALWGSGFSHHILSVGTLKKQKNHALLIRSFAQIAEGVNACLTIVGQGAARAELEQLIAQLGLQERVKLPGFYVDTYPWYRSADLFVLSSDFEGFGNVLVEAMECGVPVVSTDCLSGPAEVLDQGRFGTLVPVGDEAALARAMAAVLMQEPDGQALWHRAQDFSISRISQQYLSLFAGGYSETEAS